jgi:large subunit ribosomal protein L20
MPRSVNHVASRARRKKILALTKGYWGARGNVWTIAKNTLEKGLTYAYRDRKNKSVLCVHYGYNVLMQVCVSME